MSGAVLSLRGFESLDRKLLQLERRARRAIRRPVDIKIGFFGDFAELAAIHEYGLGVPARSFFAIAVPEMEKAAVTILRRHLNPLKPELPMRVANMIGAACQKIIQESIDTVSGPPLDPETIRQRRSGSVQMLVETGRLRAAATWKISVGGGGA